jgi:hypothetical protein
MSNWRISIGDLIFAIALAGVFMTPAWLSYLQYRARRRNSEMIHQERMAAMGKGIPLPELSNFAPILSPQPKHPNPQASLLTGIISLCASIGAMIVMFIVLPLENRVFWILPLPLALIGIGLMIYYVLFRRNAK